ncbi:hypothetical protein BST96_00435 [Oceanicoccus sagamiensis]|uniref:Uncharacterized protein n=1 Tax=Oceanicoccus sagamiensis TaxID=716816 RepID=A0A1X9N9T8_9GAMM|nr:hypothetical protein BST96_00435 [Oceanicoccus sagamiensis]
MQGFFYDLFFHSYPCFSYLPATLMWGAYHCMVSSKETLRVWIAKTFYNTPGANFEAVLNASGLTPPG